MAICNYCGNKFYKKHNRQIYCPKCKKFAYQDKNAEHQRSYKKRVKQNGLNPLIIGCKDVIQSKHRNPNFEAEARIIKNQMKLFCLK